MSRARVLIADDDPIVRRLVASTLRDGGYEVLIVGDGQEAVEAATAQRPDLIVLDLQMPRLDGREAYREIQRRGIKVPALIISANGAHQARIELNATEAMEKPFEPAELLRRVAGILSRPALGDPAAATGE